MKITVEINLSNENEVRDAIKMLTPYTGVTEAAIPAKKTTSPRAKPTPKPKTAVNPKPETEEKPETEAKPETEGATLATLKELAKAAVERTGDKDLIRKTISRYGQKLAAVTENNFEALATDLKAL